MKFHILHYHLHSTGREGNASEWHRNNANNASATYYTRHTRSVNPLNRYITAPMADSRQCIWKATMSRISASFCIVALVVAAMGVVGEPINSGDHLVSSVLMQCSDMGCVKGKVLNYLDTVLNLDGEDAREIKVLGEWLGEVGCVGVALVIVKYHWLFDGAYL